MEAAGSGAAGQEAFDRGQGFGTDVVFDALGIGGGGFGGHAQRGEEGDDFLIPGFGFGG